MINQPESETIDSSMTSPPKDVLSYSVSQNPVASELDGDSIDSSIQNALTETASNQSKKAPISIPVQELTPIERAVNEYAKINNARNKTALNQSLVSASAKDPDTAAKSQALATNLNVSTGVVDFDIELAKRQMLLRKAEAMKLAEKYPSLARSFLNQDFAEVAHDDIDNLAKTADLANELRGNLPVGMGAGDKTLFGETATKYASEMFTDFERGMISGTDTTTYGELAYQAQIPTLTTRGLVQRPDLEQSIQYAESVFSEQEEYRGTWSESFGIIVGQMSSMMVEASAVGTAFGGAAAIAGQLGPQIALPEEVITVPAAVSLGFTTSLIDQTRKVETGSAFVEYYRGSEDYEPLPYEEAAWAANIVGTLNASIELASTAFFFTPLASALPKAFLKKSIVNAFRKAITKSGATRAAATHLVKSTATEIGTEVVQEGTIVVAREITGVITEPDFQSALSTQEGRDRLEERFSSIFEVTLKGTVPLAFITGGFGLAHQMRNIARSQKRQKLITDQIATKVESKVNKRSKTTYASYLAEQLSGESLHIGVEQFEQARRKNGVGLQEVEKIIPGITEQVAKAKASGGDVVIPTSLYLSELIDTEFGVSIRNDIRADAEGMSINEIAESQEFLKELKSINKQAIEDFKKTNKDWAESAGKIEEEVFAKIKAAGNYTEEEARMLAQFHRDIAVVLASRFEMTPEQFNAKFGLSIESAYTPEQQAPAQGSFEQAAVRQTPMPSVTTTNPVSPIGLAIASIPASGVESIKDSNTFFKKVWKKLLIATGKQIRSKSDESVKAVAKMAVADMQGFVGDNPQFANYYSQDWIKTRVLLDDYAGRPITNDEFLMFRVIDGLTSPNTMLPSNISDTVKMWTYWMNKGSFDEFLLGPKPITGTSVVFESAESISGTTANVKVRTVKIVANLVKELGSVKAAIDYLREPVTVKELHAVNKTLGYAGNVSNIGNIRALVQMATGQDTLIPRMFIFGQKVGAYTLNSIGDERFTTVDIWESRYIRSFFSGMFENEIGLPVDEKEHNTFVRFGYAFKDEMERVTGKTWTPSSLQALRWFYIIAATRAAGYSKASTSETISTYTNRVLQSTFDYDQPRETNATNSTTTPPRRIEPKKYERNIDRDLDAKGITDPKQRQRITAESWIRFARGNSGSDPIGFQFDTDRSGVPRRSGTLNGLATVATHTPGVRLVDALAKAGVSTQPYVELEPTAEGVKTFSDLVRKVNANSKFGTAVYVYSDADYAKKRLFISESGKSGFALSSDGDIVSVFSESGSREGRGAMILATQMGGTKLDCFDTILPVYYAAHGFKAVARVPWNDEFIPAGWDFDAFGQYNGGRPDVVYMVYEEKYSKPYSNTDGVVVSNPDEAVAIQTKDIKTEADRAATSKARYAQLVRPPSTKFAQSAQNKPARGWFDPKQLKAMLGSKSDITTFFHELAHYYLTVYSRVASDPQSPSQVREDMDAILSWFGIAGETPEQRLATWNAMTLEEQRPHHEAFAYNKEIYVSEGKSPSIEMQGVFERFGQFIKRIYISIRDDLNAIYKQEFGTDLPMMTGEIRRVMDRMIATDEQIRSAEERRNMENIFKDQELSGMDDAQWASYQQMRAEATQKSVSELNEQSLAATTWASRLKAKKVKELEAEQEELRSEIRKQVKKEVESRNVYRAIKFLKYGILQTAGGEEVEFTGSNKLNTNAVKLMVPKENMDKFGSGKNGMVALDGYHPDIVSERFNYSSGDELILAILDAKPVDEVIDGITEDRMEIENGELNSPQAIEAAADKAVHNEARVKLVAVELRWLTKATQPVRAMIAAAKSVAKQMLETKRLRDIKPGDYASAAARAAKESQTAYFASQSAETAAKTAYTRHYNKMIAEGAEEAKAVEMATKVSDEALAKAESRSEAHKKKYGKMKPSEVAAQAKRSQLLQEQLALEANDAIDQVKKSLKYLRNVLSDKNVQKIGADNSDQIALLLERFELKNISLKEMDKRTSLANWIASQLELGLEVDISKELIEQTNKIPYRNLTLSEFNDLVDAVKTIEYMGKNENAILTAAKKAAFKETKDEIVKSINENAGDRKASTRTAKSGTIDAVIYPIKRFIAAQFKATSVVRILDGGKDDGPLWNYLIRPANKSGDKETSMKATATEAASKILNPFFKSGRMGGKGKFFVSVNESLNREEKLVIALNMGNEGNIQRMLDGYGWTLEQVIPILESMTAEELNAVQEIWDLFGTYKNEISAMSRKIFGKDLDFVEPTPIQIKSASGEIVSLRGGYYPAKYDPIASSKAQKLDEAEIAKQPLKAAYISATTSRGYSKQRAAKVVGQPLIRNLSALYSGLNEVIHDLSWREWTIDANKLMRDNAFDEEIRNRYGSLFTDQLKSWIQDVAAGDKAMDTGMDIPLNFLRQGISSAGLGFNLTSAALQVTGFNQSIIRVGPKYIGYGIMQVMKRGTGAFQEVNELSEFMANRSRTQFRELNELKNRIRGQSAVMKKVRMGTYFLMMKMQRSVDVPTWIGAYAKQLEINPDEQLARDIADQTVIDTQGSGMVKDLSGVERGGAGAKLFTVFYGYMNTVYNMAAVETMTEKKRGKLAAKYVMLFVVPVVLSYALKQLLKPSKDDDDEFDLEQMAKDLSIEQIEYLMGTMVVAREFSQIARTMIDPSAPSMGYSGPAGLRTIKDTYTAATQFGQGEFDSAFRKSAINLIGDATGLPSAQVNRTIDGIEALMEDETTDIRAPLFGVRK